MARKLPQVNTGSMADISFLLLTFFLLTSSINSEQGIPRRLPPPADKDQIVEADVRKRNVLTVIVNFRDELLVNEEFVSIDQLKDRAKEFLENPLNDENLPEKDMKFIDFMGDYPISKGVISLKNDQSTTYAMYVQVQNELQKAVNELRDKVASHYFGRKYDKLDTAMQRAVQTAIPMNISEARPVDINQQP